MNNNLNYIKYLTSNKKFILIINKNCKTILWEEALTKTNLITDLNDDELATTYVNYNINNYITNLTNLLNQCNIINFPKHLIDYKNILTLKEGKIFSYQHTS